MPTAADDTLRRGPGPGPLAAGLVAVILWGLAPVATRAAVAHLAPLPLLVLRLTVASLVMLPWAVPLFRRLRPRSAGRLAAAGILGLVGYNLPVTVGLRWLPASTAGLLLATEPVWVMLLGRVFLGERGGARAWLGSAVALSGVAVLAGPGALTAGGGYRALAGTGLVLAGTLAFGAYTIVLRPLSQAYGAIPATAASTVIGTLPYLAFAGTLSGPTLAHLDPAVWGELAFLALGSTVAGLLLWNLAVLSGGTTRVSLLLYLEPLVSVLGAAAFLGERLKPVTIAGGLLVMAGVVAASSSLGGVASHHDGDDAFHQAGGMPGADTAGADGAGVDTRARGRGGRSGRRRKHHRHGAGSRRAGQAAGPPGGADVGGSRGELPDRTDRP
jgi:drug/metabolite transporter (DMT)-like permease